MVVVVNYGQCVHESIWQLPSQRAYSFFLLKFLLFIVAVCINVVLPSLVLRDTVYHQLESTRYFFLRQQMCSESTPRFWTCLGADAQGNPQKNLLC